VTNGGCDGSHVAGCVLGGARERPVGMRGRETATTKHPLGRPVK
jgi:hypothetical protein